MTGFRRVSERSVFDGWIIKVRVGTFEAPDGSTFERDVVRHPGAVAIAPIDADGNTSLDIAVRVAAFPEEAHLRLILHPIITAANDVTRPRVTVPNAVNIIIEAMRAQVPVQ